MSILLSTDDGWIISHSRYIKKIYENVKDSDRFCSLKIDDTFFAINSQFLRNNQNHKPERSLENEVTKIKKRKRSASVIGGDSEQIDHVRQALLRILSHAAAEHVFATSDTHDKNASARIASERFYSTSAQNRPDNFHGANENDTPIIAKAGDERFVFPEKSFFYAYDVRDILTKLDCCRQYDFILMDPPWWNKFVRRKKDRSLEASYNMMHNKDLAKIPIGDLLGSDGIVAVWCTNAPSHLHSITNEMFPLWGVTYVGKWYWVKVTQSGNPVCDFNSANGKRPYEILIFGQKSVNVKTRICDNKLIVSVPSSVHSHKPPVIEIVKPYLNASPRCLEIFARYLLPHWTSWGLEVLKFQHLSLYEQVDRSKVVP